MRSDNRRRHSPGHRGVADIRIGILIEARPATGAIVGLAGRAVDRRGAIEDRLDGGFVLRLGPYGDHRAAAANRLGIVVGLILVVAFLHEGTDQPAGGGTGDGACRRGRQPTGRDDGTNAGNREKSETGQQASGAADARADAGALCGIGLTGVAISADDADVAA